MRRSPLAWRLRRERAVPATAGLSKGIAASVSVSVSVCTIRPSRARTRSESKAADG
ncbi:hypothetical protein [Streptomyces cyaneofuscatus]